MDFNRSPLIQKLINKGLVFTPSEAIQLKYLSRKGILNDLIQAEKAVDPYKFTEETTGPISQIWVDFLVGRSAEEFPDRYRTYNHAYEFMLDQDRCSENQGYRGLMLLTQLRLTKSEHQRYMNKDVFIELSYFPSYSYVHQSEAPYQQVLHLLGETFKYFIQDIDNILSLNFYLHELMDIEDFSCLRLLKMWLNKPASSDKSEDFEHLNEAYLCCSPEIIQIILDKNHHNYIMSLERRLGKLPLDFEEESLRYVKKTITEVARSFKKIDL